MKTAKLVLLVLVLGVLGVVGVGVCAYRRLPPQQVEGCPEYQVVNDQYREAIRASEPILMDPATPWETRRAIEINLELMRQNRERVARLCREKYRLR